MARVEKEVTEKLIAGPVVRARGVALVPIARTTSVVLPQIGSVWSESVPVALVVIAGGRVTAWTMEGRIEAAERWLGAVPGLAEVIATESRS